MEYSLAPHEVNPDDPQQTAEAFRFIQESLTEMYPGEQMLMVGQTDAEGSEAARERGEGGKYHVHVVINSVIAKDMVVEGERFRAGQRLRGMLTDIDELRRRMDARLNERHAEYGLPAQTLARSAASSTSGVRVILRRTGHVSRESSPTRKRCVRVSTWRSSTCR